MWVPPLSEAALAAHAFPLSRTVVLISAIGGFASLIPQIPLFVALNDPRARLDRARRDFPGRPTVALLAARAPMLVGATGLISGLMGLGLGEEWSRWSCFVCYLCYLSLDAGVFEMNLPWDSALLETLFLLAVGGETGAGRIARRALFTRIMLGFGKTKFFHASSLTSMTSLLYIREFLVGMPMPNRIGLLHHVYAPKVVFVGMILAMFFAECVVPLLGLIFHEYFLARVACFFSVAALMIGITATGNFGLFNLLTIGLALPSLASVSPEEFAALRTNPVLWMYLLGSAIQLVFFGAGLNGNWPFFMREHVATRPAVDAVCAAFRALAPLKCCNAYGVFPPLSFLPARSILVIRNRVTGETLPIPHAPTPEHDALPWFPPAWRLDAPRLPLKLYFLMRGMAHESSRADVLRASDPYAFSPNTLLDRLMLQIERGEPAVLQYLGLPRAIPRKELACEWLLCTSRASAALDASALEPFRVASVSRWFAFHRVGEIAFGEDLDEETAPDDWGVLGFAFTARYWHAQAEVSLARVLAEFSRAAKAFLADGDASRPFLTSPTLVEHRHLLEAWRLARGESVQNLRDARLGLILWTHALAACGETERPYARAARTAHARLKRAASLETALGWIVSKRTTWDDSTRDQEIVNLWPLVYPNWFQREMKWSSFLSRVLDPHNVPTDATSDATGMWFGAAYRDELGWSAAVARDGKWRVTVETAKKKDE